MGAEGLRPAAFLDRDGTLIQEAEYLADPEGVRLIPGVPEALRRLRRAGYLLVVVTNQSGIGRGLYSEEDYLRVKARLDRILSDAGVPVDATYHCPDNPDQGESLCRKPGTGMYLEAAAALGIDLSASLFVGDRLSDVLPAHALGGRGGLVRTGYGRAHEARLPPGIPVGEDLAEVVETLLAPP